MTNQLTLNSLFSAQSFKFHWGFRIGCLLFLSGLLFSGCGGGGASSPTSTTIATTTPTVSGVTFTVGGTVTDLTGGGLILQNNGGDNLAVSGAGAFTFATSIASGSPYSVSVFAHPSSPSQTCSVTNGAGTVANENITNVSVNCVTNTFTVGGTVTGLAGNGLTLRNNGGDNLAVSGAGAFTFATSIASGSPYSVSVFAHPSSPSQTCSVTNGAGTVTSANITNVSVNCVTDTFTVGGTETGLTGNGLTLQNNSGDNLAVSGAGAFTFAASIASGSAYSVSVLTQPSSPSQTCSVTNGAGTVANENITNVAVNCVTNTFTVGGTVTGLTGSGLTLQNNSGDSLTVGADGSFIFSTSIASGLAYSVSVLTQPTSPSQTCSVTNGAGTVANENITNVEVNCVTNFGFAAQAYLKAPNTEANDQFGYSVAVSGDTVAVGAIYESSNETTITNGATASADNTASSAGAVYIFKRTGATWTQEAYLKTPNAEARDYFGWSVAVSGDTVVVGAEGEDSNQTTITNGDTASADNSALYAGAVYIFGRTGVTWTQEAYLKAPNAEEGDLFGNSVAVSGDTVAVGAYEEASNQTIITNGDTASANNSAPYAGAVYIFKRTGATWTQEAYLKAPNTNTNDQFGNSLAVSGDTVAVGAYQEASNQTTITNGATASSDNSASGAGAVYVFRRTGVTWTQEAYLKAPNANPSDQFGYSVAVSGDTVAVGARSEASNQITITNGATASADNSASGAGAVYIFKRTGVTWTQEAYLKAPNAGGADSFGYSVAVSGDTVAVGAYQEASNQTTITNDATASSDNSAFNAGAAYVFRRTGVTWEQESYLKAPNAEPSDQFGSSVSVSSDSVAVGAIGEDSSQTMITNGATASADNIASSAGAVYIFVRP